MPEDLEDGQDQGMGDVSLEQPGFFFVGTDGLVVLAEAAKCQRGEDVERWLGNRDLTLNPAFSRVYYE